jgi:hypothetical protein
MHLEAPAPIKRVDVVLGIERVSLPGIAADISLAFDAKSQVCDPVKNTTLSF